PSARRGRQAPGPGDAGGAYRAGRRGVPPSADGRASPPGRKAGAEMSDPDRFRGRSVLVTGGTRGIGRVIAEAFLAAGAEVAVGGRTPPEAPPSAGGRTARFLAADVREADQAAGLVEAAAEPLGRLDVLVNNAGGAPSAEAAEGRSEERRVAKERRAWQASASDS